MAKTKSQRMKEYRQRKKEQYGEAWAKKERTRVKANYRPTALLTDEEKAKRRERNRINAMKFYHKHRKGPNTTAGIDDQGSSHEPSVEFEPQPGCSKDNLTENNTLTVKLPFHTSVRDRGPKKRQSRALQRSYRRIETLEDQNETLRRKLKSVQRRLQRTEAAKLKTANTPRSKTDALLKDSGIKPTSVPAIRKKLVYAECLNKEISHLVTEGTSEIAKLHRVVSGKVVKKYRMRAYLESMTQLERRRALKASSDKKRKLRFTAERVKSDIQRFLNRDDNSRLMPGKSDCVKVGKEKKQKRILNDYLHNLHLKFLAESDYKISRASFYRIRPKELSLVNFASRSVCLCAKHQNMSFKLKSLKNMNVCTCTSPDAFVDIYKNSPEQLHEMLEKIENQKVKFQQWKRVKLQNGKERMRIIDVEIPKESFKYTMLKEFSDFVSHVKRVTAQYKGVKAMKENLPKDHVLIQMDFSENFSCQTLEEIQSAYWNAQMVTLHPTIVYFHGGNDHLEHKSLVFVSEVLHHNASMVAAIISKTVTCVKKIKPEAKFVHFWTDSPSSQYRNRSIFDLLCNFERLYEMKATWHYFECGHGKSACDGVGGTAKRNADMAVKQSKAVIQDANDFFAWAVSSQSEIEYHLITPEEYELYDREIQRRKSEIKPVKGTMLLHAVASEENGNALLVRETTCACDVCFGESGFNGESLCKWERVVLKHIEPKSQHVSEAVSDNRVKEVEHPKGKEQIKENDFVVAVYDGKRYIGQVIEVDSDDDSVHINFMTKSGKTAGRFKWPANVDKIWVNREQILRKIDAPAPTGKGGRMFQVPGDVISFMERNDKLEGHL